MQINDFCDIAAVWGLVYVLANYVKGDNKFAGVPKSVIKHFAWVSFYELLLEIFICFTFPVIIRKFTKFKTFDPLKYGKERFM